MLLFSVCTVLIYENDYFFIIIIIIDNNDIINSNIMIYTYRICVGWTLTDLFGQMAYRRSLSSRELVRKLACALTSDISYRRVWVGACVVLCVCVYIKKWMNCYVIYIRQSINYNTLSLHYTVFGGQHYRVLANQWYFDQSRYWVEEE